AEAVAGTRIHLVSLLSEVQVRGRQVRVCRQGNARWPRTAQGRVLPEDVVLQGAELARPSTRDGPETQGRQLRRANGTDAEQGLRGHHVDRTVGVSDRQVQLRKREPGFSAG